MSRRARSEEQKEGRRQAILDAALALFGETSYDALTMAAVAERAGLAKGTVYLYFRTKEELFLAITADELSAWFGAVDARLAAAPAPATPAVVARILAGSLDGRLALARLLAILQSVLEQNIDLPTAIAFKRRLAGHIGRTGPLLEARLPLGPGGGATLLLRVNALVVGLQHLSDPAPVSREALREPDLALFQVELLPALEETLRLILVGIVAEQSGQRPAAREH